jgi:hypothetical protein
VRIELSRPVFATLHKLKNLKDLQIRLQDGPSLYSNPPALPLISNTQPPVFDIPQPHGPPTNIPPPPPPGFTFTPSGNVNAGLPPPPPPPSAGPQFILFNTPAPTSPPPNLPLPSPPKVSSTPKTKAVKVIKREPPTFSGFKNLRTLAVLDMDSLSCIDEIASCVRNSSTSLETLKLSLSEKLALKARKPSPDDDADSDEDNPDEFGNQLPPPPPAGSTEASQEKEAKARAERTAQEAILSRIFELVQPKPADEKVDSAEKEPSEDGKASESTKDDLPEEQKVFMETLSAIMKNVTLADDDLKGGSRQEVEKLILQAAEAHLKAQKDKGNPSISTTEAGPSNSVVPSIESSKSSQGSKDKVEAVMAGAVGAEDMDSIKGKGKEPEGNADNSEVNAEDKGLFDDPSPSSKNKRKEKLPSDDSTPEDIDVDHPDVDPNDFEDAQEKALEEAIAEQKAEELSAGDEDIPILIPTIKDPIEGETLGPDPAAIEDSPNGLVIKKDEVTEQFTPASSKTSSVMTAAEPTPAATDKEAMTIYIRKSRGVPLKSLALFRVPLRSSVLTRSLNLSTLESITLLEVGNQVSFWKLLSQTNATTPLKLSKIYSDHVTKEFLTCVGELPRVSQLFMLERAIKHRLDSTLETTVGIEHIRKLALKKHVKTLTKLMIKHENTSDYSWDLDHRTIMLLTKYGKNLKELAASVDLRNFVRFSA